MAYIGNPILTTDYPVNTFSGNGSTTAFTLSLAPASVNSILVAVSGVIQDPSTYTVSGTTLTFTAAPPSGTNNISVRHLGIAGIPNTPSAGSVQYSSLNSSLQGTLVGKNRIINGAMMIDQRNAGASVTIGATATTYVIDRFFGYADQASKFSIQQNAGSVTLPAGFTNYLGVTSLSAYTPSSSEVFIIGQPIEGLNVADLAWGTANAKTVTLSFWVRSSLTGTFSGSLRNSAVNRSYPFSYTISSANTWEQKSITVVGDTSGTWLTTSGIGIRLVFNLGSGSTNLGTSGAWAANGAVGVTGTTSVVGTNGATFYITGVQLEVGSTATSFDYRPYGTELALCQRYYQKLTAGTSSYAVYGSGYTDSTTVAYYYVKYTTSMRATPTANFSTLQVDSSGFAGTVTSISNLQAGLDSAQVGVTCSGGGLTAARPSNLRSANSTSGFIDFAAEL